MKRRLILLMAFVALIGAKADAQTAVATAGGEAGTVSYTVGQTFVDVAVSDKGSLTPGVQQAYVITTVEVGMPEQAAAVELSAYPNPVADRLTLTTDAADANLRYTLTDATGRTITADEITDAQIAIDMAYQPAGIYFLRVDNGKNMVKTFKIVKN